MRHALVPGQLTVADLQHFCVVPVAGAGIRVQVRGGVDALEDAHSAPVEGAVIAGPDVRGDPPQVADALTPLPGLVLAPFADGEDNRTSAGLDGLGHRLVRSLGILAIVGAPVILEVINPPLGVLEGILELVALAAGSPLAGEGAGAGIHAELQAQVVDVVRKGLHPGREPLRIGDDVAVRVAVHLPAVVDDDILVSGVGHARSGHRVSDLLDELFAHVTAELVLAVPAHGRGGCKAPVQGVGQGFGLLLRGEAGAAQGECGHGGQDSFQVSFHIQSRKDRSCTAPSAWTTCSAHPAEWDRSSTCRRSRRAGQ